MDTHPEETKKLVKNFPFVLIRENVLFFGKENTPGRSEETKKNALECLARICLEKRRRDCQGIVPA